MLDLQFSLFIDFNSKYTTKNNDVEFLHGYVPTYVLHDLATYWFVHLRNTLMLYSLGMNNVLSLHKQ